MAYFVLLFISLSAFWLLLSGYWDNHLLLGLGFLSVAFVTWLAIRADWVDRGRFDARLLPRLLLYWGWLIREIVKANRDVVRCIWSPRKHPISPCMGRLRVSQGTALGRTIYAQSITLTPGTVAIDLEDGSLLVHALMREGLDELRGGEMDRRVSALEQGSG